MTKKDERTTFVFPDGEQRRLVISEERQISEITSLSKGSDEQWPAYMQWKSMLTEHMMHKHNQGFELKDVASKLQVELGPIEAGSMSVFLVRCLCS